MARATEIFADINNIRKNNYPIHKGNFRSPLKLEPGNICQNA